MATAASSASPAGSRIGWRPGAALARRTLRDARARTIGFTYLFAIVAYIQPVSYRHTYPTVAERLAFSHSFANNKAVVLFYGKAYDLLTVGGYSAWRVGGTLAIFAAVFGLLAPVRAMRSEEESGRSEVVLATPVGRSTSFLASLAAIAAGVLLLWLATLAGSVAGGLPVGGSAFLALAVASVVPVFAGVGALASQLAPTRRMALELGGAVVAISFLLRVVADTSSAVSWLRWTTPLGWAQELRPFTGERPLIFLLPAVSSLALLVIAAQLAARRDIGTGILASRDTRDPRLFLLSSPTSQALRAETTSLSIWLTSVGILALIIGIISKSISSAGISKQLDRKLAQLGSGSVLTPKGYLGFSFIFFVLAISLFACSQVSAARHEEAGERLETLLSLPRSRREWLGGRLALAAAGATAIALVGGIAAWVGATSQGVHISLLAMVGAGANCLPVALLFLGVAVLAYGSVPRAGAGIAYGLVIAAFLWQLFGSLFGAPRWLVDATPFAHVGLVPAQPFRAGAAAAMVGVGVLGAIAGLVCFERRDLMSA